MKDHAEIIRECRAILWPNGFSADDDAFNRWDADTVEALAALLMPTKHEHHEQKGLFFWAESVDPLDKTPSASFHVIAQAEGYPATEAFDDWLRYEKDADEIAQQLAKGEL